MERIQAAIEKARALRENQPLPDPAAAPVAVPDAPAKAKPGPQAKPAAKNGSVKSAPPVEEAETSAPPRRKGLKLKRTEAEGPCSGGADNTS